MILLIKALWEALALLLESAWKALLDKELEPTPIPTSAPIIVVAPPLPPAVPGEIRGTAKRKKHKKRKH